jgi:asparagine N-glycosylation enzyme membrane subunit Stt3
MSNIEKIMENILPITRVIGSGLICFSSLMLILSLIKKTRKIFLKTAGLSVLCGITIFIVPMIGKLMYLVPWKDMLLLVIGILILVIISERLKEN